MSVNENKQNFDYQSNIKSIGLRWFLYFILMNILLFYIKKWNVNNNHNFLSIRSKNSNLCMMVEHIVRLLLMFDDFLIVLLWFLIILTLTIFCFFHIWSSIVIRIVKVYGNFFFFDYCNFYFLFLLFLFNLVFALWRFFYSLELISL